MSEVSYPCPACGFLTLDEPPGSYNLCSICDWEDDFVQLKHPIMGGGANKESLYEYQKLIIRKYPIEVQVAGIFIRDPEWRPLTDEDTQTNAVTPTSGMEYFQSFEDDTVEYYWQKRKETGL